MTAARIPFTATDESAIRMLNGSMLFLLIIHFVIGGLMLLGGCFSFVGVPANFQMHPGAGAGAIITAICLVIDALGMLGQGVLLLQIRQALEGVLATDTQDQALLAQAFAKLKLFFLLEAVLFLVLMAMSCGGFLTQAFGPVNPLLSGQGFGGGM